jgi:hypothetical protein
MRAVYLEEKEDVLTLLIRQKQKKKQTTESINREYGIFLHEEEDECFGGPEKN